MIAARSIRDLAVDLASGRVSAVELAQASLAAAERTNPVLRSFITIAEREALAQARESDARRHANRTRGLLDGVPYAAKDLFQTTRHPHHGGKQGVAGLGAGNIGRGHPAARRRRRHDDRQAPNLHEFAYGATGENHWAGTVANPHDATRLAGGSSSGSAAAVAAGIVPFALGTDTGGSVRVPAALCGIAGYKPSPGRISLEGVVPYCWSLDHAGILARSVEDVAVVAQCLDAVSTEAMAAALPSRPLTVGILLDWTRKSDPAVRAGLDAARALLARRGASFIEIELPDPGGSEDRIPRHPTGGGARLSRPASAAGGRCVRRRHSRRLRARPVPVGGKLHPVQATDGWLSAGGAQLFRDGRFPAHAGLSDHRAADRHHERHRGSRKHADRQCPDALHLLLQSHRRAGRGTAGRPRRPGLPVGVQIIGKAQADASVLRSLPCSLKRTGSAHPRRLTSASPHRNDFSHPGAKTGPIQTGTRTMINVQRRSKYALALAAAGAIALCPADAFAEEQLRRRLVRRRLWRARPKAFFEAHAAATGRQGADRRL